MSTPTESPRLRRGDSCCAPEQAAGSGRRRTWWRVGGSVAIGGVALALVPKCPICIAAWLGGLTVAIGAVLEGVRAALW